MSTYFSIRLPDDARREIAWQAIVQYLSPWVKTAKTALEIGAGQCSCINELPVPRRLAIDQDVASKHYARAGVEFREMNLLRLADIQETFDLIIASNIFEHLTNEEFAALLPQIKQKLTPGGKLIVMQPNFFYAYRHYFDDYTHKKIFTHEGLRGALTAEGLNVIHCAPRFLPFSLKQSPRFVPLWLTKLGIRLYLRSPWRPGAGQMLLIAENTV